MDITLLILSIFFKKVSNTKEFMWEHFLTSENQQTR